MSIKISKMSYFSFSVKLNEKKETLSMVWRGGLIESFRWKILVLFCKEVSPMYCNEEIKVFFSTVVIWWCFMNKLSTIVLKQLSVNDQVYPFLKNACYKNYLRSEQILLKHLCMPWFNVYIPISSNKCFCFFNRKLVKHVTN